MSFSALKEFTDKIGCGYGTEDKSVFIYSLIKMFRPSLMLEFGTGAGAVMLWSGTGFKENGFGKIITIDNGWEWDNNQRFKANMLARIGEKIDSYSEYINTLRYKFDVIKQTEFINSQIQLNPTYIRNIAGDSLVDIIFSDFDHGPETIFNLFANIVPIMSSNGVLLIDSASTSITSYLLLETIINKLNTNSQLDILNCVSEDNVKMRDFYNIHQLKLTHIIENKERDQNSIAMIQVTLRDVIPCDKHLLRL